SQSCHKQGFGPITSKDAPTTPFGVNASGKNLSLRCVLRGNWCSARSRRRRSSSLSKVTAMYSSHWPNMYLTRFLALSGQCRMLLAGGRGATAVIFAATSVALMGLVGLGAEAGNWYVMKRHGQNGADAAAVAGALTLATASGASGCTTSLQTTAGTSGTSVAG